MQLPPPNASGRIWGADIYTNDSHICAAAIHSGVIVTNIGGLVAIEGRPGLKAEDKQYRQGCTAVAVAQLINYHLSHDYKNGWLDRILEDVEVYPRPWASGLEWVPYIGSADPACKAPGWDTLDFYPNVIDMRDVNEASQLINFLWRVGIGLDLSYEANVTDSRVYNSELSIPEVLEDWSSNSNTPYGRSVKLGSLLKDRFRFGSVSSTQAAAQLNDVSDVIRSSIDQGNPLLLSLSNTSLSKLVGHNALIHGYRQVVGCGPDEYEFLINMGWGDNDKKEEEGSNKWYPGNGAISAGGHIFNQFVVLQAAPVPQILKDDSALLERRVDEMCVGLPLVCREVLKKTVNAWWDEALLQMFDRHAARRSFEMLFSNPGAIADDTERLKLFEEMLKDEAFIGEFREKLNDEFLSREDIGLPQLDKSATKRIASDIAISIVTDLVIKSFADYAENNGKVDLAYWIRTAVKPTIEIGSLAQGLAAGSTTVVGAYVGSGLIWGKNIYSFTVLGMHLNADEAAGKDVESELERLAKQNASIVESLTTGETRGVLYDGYPLRDITQKEVDTLNDLLLANNNHQIALLKKQAMYAEFSWVTEGAKKFAAVVEGVVGPLKRSAELVGGQANMTLAGLHTLPKTRKGAETPSLFSCIKMHDVCTLEQANELLEAGRPK